MKTTEKATIGSNVVGTLNLPGPLQLWTTPGYNRTWLDAVEPIPKGQDAYTGVSSISSGWHRTAANKQTELRI